MVLSYYLSRKNHNDSNRHKIIPISFNMYKLLHEKYYNIGKTVTKNIWYKHNPKQNLVEFNFQRLMV